VRQLKSRRLWIAALGVLVLSLGAAAFLSPRKVSSEPVASAPPVPALTVTTAMPRQLSWPVTVTAWGGIAAWQEASIDAQIGGYSLIDLRVNVGDKVKRGQLLARINPDQLRAEVAQLKAALVQAEATAAQADANRQRMLSLRDSGGISEQDILQYVTQSDTAKAQVDAARATLEAKQIQLSDTDVLAPDDGTISGRSASLGAVVSVGQELFRMIRQDRLEWRGELTAAQIAQARPDQVVKLVLPDGSAATARVRQIAPSFDTTSRLGTVYADLAPSVSARSGMYASGQLLVYDTAALVIPAASVVIRDGNSYVFVVHGRGATPTVSLRPVTVGRRQADQVEIANGLGAIDQVVVQGAGFLNDGNVVRVAGASTLPASPASLAATKPGGRV
jgi:RND family efflux transporter MFP subunit